MARGSGWGSSVRRRRRRGQDPDRRLGAELALPPHQAERSVHAHPHRPDADDAPAGRGRVDREPSLGAAGRRRATPGGRPVGARRRRAGRWPARAPRREPRGGWQCSVTTPASSEPSTTRSPSSASVAADLGPLGEHHAGQGDEGDGGDGDGQLGPARGEARRPGRRRPAPGRPTGAASSTASVAERERSVPRRRRHGLEHPRQHLLGRHPAHPQLAAQDQAVGRARASPRPSRRRASRSRGPASSAWARASFTSASEPRGLAPTWSDGSARVAVTMATT